LVTFKIETVMKTFSDLEFKPNPRGSGIISRIKFDNGYGASVVKGPHTYGGNEGLYELAVIDANDQVTYETPVTDDVEGYLTEEDVTILLKQIQNL
jgi:hypothetical protein